MVQAGSIANTVGQISIYGGMTASASAMLISGAAAGLGTAGSITGDVNLSGYSALVFASGQISTIAAGGSLSLNGPQAFVADKTSNSAYTSSTALAGLTMVRGQLYLTGASSVTTSQAVTNYGEIDLNGGDENLQTSLVIGGNLSNTSIGSVYVGSGGEGFDTLTINGALTNNGTFEISTSADAAIVKATALVNTGILALNSAAPTSSFVTLDVASAAGFGTAGVVTGSVRLANNATIEFASGEIKTIATEATLALGGDDAFIADASALASNSALTGLTSVQGILALSSGAKITTSAGVNVSGTLDMDSGYYEGLGVSGGTSLTVGGALIDNGSVVIGDEDLDFGDAVTVNSISVNSSAQLSVAGAPGAGTVLDVKGSAGFGAPNVLTGDVSVSGNALIEFSSGQINTITSGATLAISGADAFVADAGALTTNSALTGLTTVQGALELDSGVKLTTTGGMTVTGSLSVDSYNSYSAPEPGGSSLTIAGALVDSGAIAIGATNLVAADAVTVNSLVVNSGHSLTLSGVLGGAEAELNDKGAAGTGTAGALTGDVTLSGHALLEFASAEITTIKGLLDLIGADVYVADAGALTSDSALTGLSSVQGTLELSSGASVKTSAGLTVSGALDVDNYNYVVSTSGGSSFTVTGALVDSGTIDIGNDDNLTANVAVTVNSLTVNGSLSVEGMVGGGDAVLNVKSAAGSGGTGILNGEITVLGNAAIEFASGEITTIEGTLTLEGAHAFLANTTPTSNSALTGLQTISSGGDLALAYGAAVSVTANLTNSGSITLDEYDYAVGGTIGGSSLTVGGTFTNQAEIYLGSDDLVENVKLTAKSLVNNGYMDLYGDGSFGAVISTTSGFANNSTVSVQNGDQTISGAVTGTGSFSLGSGDETLDFTGSVAAGQTVDFDEFSTATETLTLGDAAQFSATINNFALDDNLAAGAEIINASGFGGSTTWGLSNNVLTLTDGSKTAKLTFTGTTYSLSDFHISNSGTTTIITNA